MSTIGGKRATVTDWVKARSRLTMILFGVFCLLLGLSTAMIIGRTQPNVCFVAYGGNTDPGDGAGGGQFKNQLVDGGWAPAEAIFQVTWEASIQNGTIRQTNEAMAAGKEAIAQCGGRHVIVAGFSLGTSPALQLAREAGIRPADNYIFGGPAPATGIWHNAWVDNPWVEPAVREFGGLAPDRFVPAGTQVFFDVRDPYANAAPQCSQPWALTLDGHRVITRAEAEGGHIWTGPDGAVNHEAGYVPQPQLPLSGADPSPIWAGCYFNDWHKTPNSPSDSPTDRGGGPGGIGSGGTDVQGDPGGPSPAPTPALPGAGQQSPQLPGLPGAGG